MLPVAGPYLRCSFYAVARGGDASHRAGPQLIVSDRSNTYLRAIAVIVIIVAARAAPCSARTGRTAAAAGTGAYRAFIASAAGSGRCSLAASAASRTRTFYIITTSRSTACALNTAT